MGSLSKLKGFFLSMAVALTCLLTDAGVTLGIVLLYEAATSDLEVGKRKGKYQKGQQNAFVGLHG